MRVEWTPALHEARILRRLASGSMTSKAIAGSLANWPTRSDCHQALVRLVERGDVVEVAGIRKRRFALMDWLER